MKADLVRNNLGLQPSGRHAKYFAASMLIALLIVIALASLVMVVISCTSS